MEAIHTQTYQACCYLKLHHFTAPLCTWETAHYRPIHSQIRKIRLDQATFPGRDQAGHAAEDTWGLME